MGKFSDSIQAVRKVNNHAGARSAKIDIRRRVLAAVPSPKVFDAFAGSGEMYRGVWKDADAYTGCDQEFFRHDLRPAFVADNRRVLRCIDLDQFNIFDLDAYGSPWEQALIIAARRPVVAGETIGIVLTEGSGLKLKQGGIPKALAQIAGLRGRPTGLARWQDDLTDMAIAGLARRMRCEVTRRWQAKGKTGAGVRYIGMVLQGREPAVE